MNFKNNEIATWRTERESSYSCGRDLFEGIGSYDCESSSSESTGLAGRLKTQGRNAYVVISDSRYVSLVISWKEDHPNTSSMTPQADSE